MPGQTQGEGPEGFHGPVNVSPDRKMVSSEILSTVKVAELFKIGETARIGAGALMGHDAEVAELPDCAIGDLDASARVGLVKILFGRPVRFELPIGAIERIG